MLRDYVVYIFSDKPKKFMFHSNKFRCTSQCTLMYIYVVPDIRYFVFIDEILCIKITSDIEKCWAILYHADSLL